MRIFPIILSFYLSRMFLMRVAIVLATISIIIIISTFFEIIRASYGKQVPLRMVMQLALMKYPYLLQRAMPFIILFASTFTFLHLARTSELVIIKAAGVSIWQFLTPIIIISLLIGIFMTTVFSYISANLLSKQERLVQKYLRDVPQTLLVSKSGLWLREHSENNNIIIYAKHYQYKKEMFLHQIKFFILSSDNFFQHRIEAATAKLQPGAWQLYDVKLMQANHPAQYYKELSVNTKFIKEQLQDSFATPEMIPFGELPSFINMLKNAGFSAVKYSLYYYRLLLQPVFMCTMVMIATSFSLPLPRQKKIIIVVALGLLIGFIVYFMVDLMTVLGLSGQIPAILAVSSPIMIAMLISVAMVLHLEDG